MANPLNIVAVIKNTLNCVDHRLIDHGNAVAYSIYQILRQSGLCTEKQMRDICLAAMLHDIGAYKTEDIDQLIQFETETAWDHSIYGYLFLKYFSPLQDLAPAVLYHHADLAEMQAVPPEHQELAQLFYIADRIDIARKEGRTGIGLVRSLLERGRGRLFQPHIADYLLHEERLPLLYNGSPADDPAYSALLYQSGWTDEELLSLIRMIVLSIDFRSPQTVTHTIATTHISTALGKLCSLPEQEFTDLRMGAWLHDIGKAGIPVEILEKPGGLDDRQFEIMRSHILLTGEILDRHVDRTVYNIACRHHERLDGSGYPAGYCEKNLTTSERIVAVADVFSALSGVRSYKAAYPKRKVCSLLSDLGERGQLDSQIVQVALTHYDAIMEEVGTNSQTIIGIYREMQREYAQLLKKIHGGASVHSGMHLRVLESS